MTVLLTQGAHAQGVIAMVDSGADGTLLPRGLAPLLGVNDLVATPEGSGGAGNTSFPTWSTQAQIIGQIVAYLQPAQPQLWGPTFPVTPLFAEDTTPLLGRNDFFGAFAITFVEDASLGQVVHLDY